MKSKNLKTLIESVFAEPVSEGFPMRHEGDTYEIEYYSSTLESDIKAQVLVVTEPAERGDDVTPSFDASFNAEIQKVEFHDFDGEARDDGWKDLPDFWKILPRNEISDIEDYAKERAADAAEIDPVYEGATVSTETFNMTLLPESHPDGLDVQVEAVIDPRMKGSKYDPTFSPVVKFNSIRILESNKIIPFKNLSQEDQEALTEHALDLFKFSLKNSALNEFEQPLDFGRFDKSLRDD
jgi:hypothetical protein